MVRECALEGEGRGLGQRGKGMLGQRGEWWGLGERGYLRVSHCHQVLHPKGTCTTTQVWGESDKICSSRHHGSSPAPCVARHMDVTRNAPGASVPPDVTHGVWPLVYEPGVNLGVTVAERRAVRSWSRFESPASPRHSHCSRAGFTAPESNMTSVGLHIGADPESETGSRV